MVKGQLRKIPRQLPWTVEEGENRAVTDGMFATDCVCAPLSQIPVRG
jgi:hypothetical protein